jgi:predicted RND superfamily exporter protein
MAQPLTLNNKASNALIRFMIWWDRSILSRPWWLLLFVLVTSGLTFKYALDNLNFNTNTADMISTDVPFQQKRLRLERAFPQDVNDILLVIESETPERTTQAVEQLAAQLRADTQYIKGVYIPGEEE